jgi:hypothetical protein
MCNFISTKHIIAGSRISVGTTDRAEEIQTFGDLMMD